MVEIRDFVAAGENRASKATKKNSWGFGDTVSPLPPMGSGAKPRKSF